MSGANVTITPQAAGRTSITVTADDGQDSSADQTIAVRVNRAVTATGTIPVQTMGALKADVDVDVSSYFSDPDTADTITYTASSSDDTKATASVSNSTVTISGEAVGTPTITVTATDGLTSASQIISVTVVANRAPKNPTPIPDMTATLHTYAKTLDLSNYFSDPDGDTLTYTTSQSSNQQISLSVSGSILTMAHRSTSHGNNTPVTITVTASDGTVSVSDIFIHTTKYNTAPKRTSGFADWNLRVPNTITRDLSGKFEDDDGDPLTYRVDSSTSSILGSATISGSTLTLKAERTGAVPSSAGPTDWDIHVAASDGAAEVTGGRILRIRVWPRGKTTTPTIPNAAPQKVGTMPNEYVATGVSFKVDASKYFSEADGDVMMYGASVADGGGEADVTVLQDGPKGSTDNHHRCL